MNVTLKQNSWHYKLYSKVISNNPPKTLCPYFWSLVAILLFSPALIIGWLFSQIGKGFTWVRKSLTIEKKRESLSEEQRWQEIKKKIDEMERRDRINRHRWDIISNFTTKLFKWVVLPLLAVGVVYSIFQGVNKLGLIPFLIAIGISLGIILVVVGFIWLSDKYGSRIVNPIMDNLIKINPAKWSVVQLIGGMIYSFYVKACPIIQWEDKKVKEQEVWNQ